LGDQGGDGNIILKWTITKQNEKGGADYMRGMERSGGLLRTW
jgi:hypothetical protein